MFRIGMKILNATTFFHGRLHIPIPNYPIDEVSMKKAHSSYHPDSSNSLAGQMMALARRIASTPAARRLRLTHHRHVVGCTLPTTPYTVFLALMIVVMLLMPSARAAAVSSAPVTAGYEIPLDELNKVKKERPPKKVIKARKKKKAESTAKPPAASVAVPPEKVEQTPAATSEAASRVVAPESRHDAASEKTDRGVADLAERPQTAPDFVTLHHDPNSYVIAGKRTMIQAVISSAAGIQVVYCRFSAAENGTYAIVPMVQVPGTLYTYAANLPSLAATSRTLRYNIVAVDSSGKELRSREFVIAVRSSSVLPGWQLENAPDRIKIRLENRDTPLEGFSDPGIVE